LRCVFTASAAKLKYYRIVIPEIFLVPFSFQFKIPEWVFELRLENIRECVVLCKPLKLSLCHGAKITDKKYSPQIPQSFRRFFLRIVREISGKIKTE
jgi:hypothetical protein